MLALGITDGITGGAALVRDGQVFVDPKPFPAGTPVEPARVEESN